MARISKLSIAFSGALTHVSKVIREHWKPGKLTSEREYRSSLAEFLREAAPDAKLEKEYRHDGTTTDIYFKYDAEIFIELKYNLQRKGDCDRLVGQIEGLNPKKHKIIVVLCGDEQNESLHGRLQEKYRTGWEGTSPVIIVQDPQRDLAVQAAEKARQMKAASK
jgi:hypothetical protein